MPAARPDPEIPWALTESDQSRSAVMAFLDPDDIARYFKPGDVVCSIEAEVVDYHAAFDCELALLGHPKYPNVIDGERKKTPLGVLTLSTPQYGPDGRVYVSVVVQGVCRVRNEWVGAVGYKAFDSKCPPGIKLHILTTPTKRVGDRNFLRARLVVYDEPTCLVHLE